MSVADMLAARAVSSSTILVYPFTEAMRTVAAGKRLIVVRWKAGKNEDGTVRNAHTPVACVVPGLSPFTNGNVLEGIFSDAFEAAQDALVRELIETEMERDWNLIGFGFGEDAISINAVAAWYEERSAGAGRGAGKLSKEQIGTWFDAELGDLLSVKFAEVLGIPETGDIDEKLVKKLEVVVGQYRDLMCKLAAPKVSVKVNNLVQIEKALEFAADADVMKKRLLVIVGKAKVQVDDAVMSLL